MADLLDFVAPLAVAQQVGQQTGKTADSAIAGGYASFIQSITKEPPTIVPLPNKRARLLLNQRQINLMQKWLDTQAGFALAKPKESSLEIDLKPVLVPWSMKYLIPVAALFILAGWLGHHYLSR